MILLILIPKCNKLYFIMYKWVMVDKKKEVTYEKDFKQEV